MQITIDDMLKGLCPEIRLGVISYNARVCEKCDDLWLFMQQNTLKTVRGRLADAPVSEYANIAEARAAYRAFGQDPTRYRVSSEALLRRIGQGKPLYQINSIVDTCNMISLESGFSVGSYDESRITGNVELRLGRRDESYEGIGRGTVKVERLPLLADPASPFGGTTCDSIRAMITPGDKSITTVIYSFSANNDLEIYLLKALGWLEKFAGAKDLKSNIVE